MTSKCYQKNKEKLNTEAREIYQKYKEKLRKVARERARK